jgi:ACT domain-containing protein
MNRIVVTIIGMDMIGIIGKVCNYFAINGNNITDIAQTTLNDIISMIMIVDVEPTDDKMKEIRKDLERISKDIGCIITVVKYDELKILAEA